MTKDEFLKRLKEDEEYSPGWQVIDDAFEKLYPGQEPSHYGTNIQARAMFGGDEFLDGYSIYQSPNGYRHFVTYGMTILYGDEEAFGREYNGWGYELTFKLKDDPEDDGLWAIDMMSNLARYTFQQGRPFDPDDIIPGNGTPIHIGADSMITGLIVVPDTEAETQQCEYGLTEFHQLVGITEQEQNALKKDVNRVQELIDLMKADGNLHLVTDMHRTKSYLTEED